MTDYVQRVPGCTCGGEVLVSFSGLRGDPGLMKRINGFELKVLAVPGREPLPSETATASRSVPPLWGNGSHAALKGPPFLPFPLTRLRWQCALQPPHDQGAPGDKNSNKKDTFILLVADSHLSEKHFGHKN